MLNWTHRYFSFPAGQLASHILNLEISRPETRFQGRRSAVKKGILLIAAWLCFAAIAAAQEPDELPPNPDMQRQELVNLEKENARAIKLHNATFFKAAYSDDFHGVSRFGETVSKQGIVRELETLPLEFESVVSSDEQVRMFRDAAYVLSLRSEVGHAQGKRFYNQFRILRVYVNTPRGWKIVSQLENELMAGGNR
jgi:hypothetical protein